MSLFGTDGVRGLANADLTPELALALGAAAVRVLVPPPPLSPGGWPNKPLVLVGNDPRPSSPMLASALAAGIASAGADAMRLGVVPTGLVAHAAARRGVVGVTITASHNPAPDNGIKIFGPGGRKLTDAEQDAIEAAMSTPVDPALRPTGVAVGATFGCDGSDEAEYAESLLATVPVSLAGVRLVVDCANGASAHLAPEVYRRAGAEVEAIHAGDGQINDNCGATHLESLQKAVTAGGFDLGIAHDGDADRCLLVDHTGSVVDGDQILAILGAGEAAIVTTVMANLGLHRAMAAAGTRVVTTPVGDRAVLEAMQAEGIRLGGEQSGHVILLEHAVTGDGLLTALQVLTRVARSGKKLADLAAVVHRLPQVLKGVRAPKSVLELPAVTDAIAAETAALGDAGRVLVRASGTEPLVRVMVEAETAGQAEAVCERLCDVVRAAL